jgi:hypothetical protein
MPDSNQASYIFGFIFLAFFVYITLKGELPVYAGLLLLSPASSGAGTSSTSNSAAQAQTASQIVQGAFGVMGM